MTAWRQSMERFLGWFVDHSVPLWLARAYDEERGGFFETLDFNGAPIVGQTRRVRVQTRQIHTFSRLAMRGWAPEGDALAAKGFSFFLETACPQDGARGCVHLLDESGAVTDDKRDLYDQAFLLLACASRWKAAQDERARRLAEKTVAFLDDELASPHGGWFENDRKDNPRRQNPHMHLFEAFMALYDATGDERYLHKADHINGLFQRVFWDEDEKVLREFFTPDLAAKDDAKGDVIEPGHMMEWAWLLGVYDGIRNTDHSGVMRTLFARAKETGLDGAGYLVDAAIVNSGEIGGGRRLWPQTEYLKACVTLSRRGDKLESETAALIERLFDDYLNQPVTGLWQDQFASGDKAPLAGDVPASILYHLYEAAAEISDFCNSAGKA